MPLLLAMGSPVGVVNPPSTWGEIFLFFAPPLKFAIFANMMDDNRTITYVSDSTSGSYSDYLWIPREPQKSPSKPSQNTSASTATTSQTTSTTPSESHSTHGSTPYASKKPNGLSRHPRPLQLLPLVQVHHRHHSRLLAQYVPC